MSDRTPIHPGEILSQEFLIPMGISQSRLARDINVPARRINDQWRICFVWRGEDAYDVEITDTH